MSNSTDTGSVVAETELTHAGPSVLQGRRAMAFATLSSHETTTAIWLIGFTGEACGAWILDTTTKQQAQVALSILDRRAIIEDPQGGAGTALGRLVSMGEVPAPEVSARLASLGELHEAIQAARATYGLAASAHGNKTKTTLTPLAWPTPLAESLDDDTSRARRMWRGQGPAPEAFVVGATARRLIRLWNETESLRVRRANLREQYGEAQTLPKMWREAAFVAYEQPFEGLPAVPSLPKD